MRSTDDFYKKYFEENNKAWLEGAYETGKYNYPVGFHRLRILKKVFSTCEVKDKKVLDIGCGGGDVSFFLASRGAFVTGIDMSDTMLSTCEEQLQSQYADLEGRVHFFKENVNCLSGRVTSETYDYVIAFGLIGYLDCDETFFEIIKGLVHANSRVILSCRNELFNMTSISENTKREIKKGNAEKLIDEIDRLYEKPLSIEKCRIFISDLKNALTAIEARNDLSISKDEAVAEGNDGVGEIQPRQSTPEEVAFVAEKYGFNREGFYGVHPHLLLPRMNRMLPEQVFNMLSNALCAFEDEDISLIYSSVFIGVFVKR